MVGRSGTSYERRRNCAAAVACPRCPAGGWIHHPLPPTTHTTHHRPHHPPPTPEHPPPPTTPTTTPHFCPFFQSGSRFGRMRTARWSCPSLRPRTEPYRLGCRRHHGSQRNSLRLVRPGGPPQPRPPLQGAHHLGRLQRRHQVYRLQVGSDAGRATPTWESRSTPGRGSRSGGWWWMLGGGWWVVWSAVGGVGGGWQWVMYPASSWAPRASHRRRTVPPPLISGSAPPNPLLRSKATLRLEAGGARTPLQSR